MQRRGRSARGTSRAPADSQTIAIDPKRFYLSLPFHPGANGEERRAEVERFLLVLHRECLVTAARLEYPFDLR